MNMSNLNTLTEYLKIAINNPSYIQDFLKDKTHLIPNPVSPHEIQQTLYRAYLCRECLDNDNKCLVCKCPVTKIIKIPQRSDSKKRWGPFLDPTQWEKYKEDSPSYKEFLTNLDEFVLKYFPNGII